MKFSNFISYKKQVGRLLKSRFGINLSDVSEASIRDSYESGWEPNDHVEWLGASLAENN